MAPVTLARGNTAEPSHGSHQGPALRGPELEPGDRAVPDGDQRCLNDTPGQHSHHCVAPSLRKGWWQTVLAANISSMSVLEQDAVAYPPSSEAEHWGSCAFGVARAQPDGDEAAAHDNVLSPPPLVHLEPPDPSERHTPIVDRIRAHDGGRASAMEINSMQGMFPPGPIVDGCHLCQKKYSVAVATALLCLLRRFWMQSAGSESMSAEPHPRAADDGPLMRHPDPEPIRQPCVDDTGRFPPRPAAEIPPLRHHEANVTSMKAQAGPGSKGSGVSSIEKGITKIGYEHHDEELQSDSPPVLPSIELGHLTERASSLPKNISPPGTTSGNSISRKRKHPGTDPVSYDDSSRVPRAHDNSHEDYIDFPALHDTERSEVDNESGNQSPSPVYSLPPWSDSSVSVTRNSSPKLDEVGNESGNQTPSPMYALPPYSQSVAPQDEISNEFSNQPVLPAYLSPPDSESAPSQEEIHDEFSNQPLSPTYSLPPYSESAASAQRISSPEQDEASSEDRNLSQSAVCNLPSWTDSAASADQIPLPERDEVNNESRDESHNLSPPPIYSLPSWTDSAASADRISSPRAPSPSQLSIHESKHLTPSRDNSLSAPPSTDTPPIVPNVDAPQETEPLRRSKRQRISRISLLSESSTAPTRPEAEGPPSKRRRTGPGRPRGEVKRPTRPTERAEPPILDVIYVKGDYASPASPAYNRGSSQQLRVVGASIGSVRGPRRFRGSLRRTGL